MGPPAAIASGIGSSFGVVGGLVSGLAQAGALKAQAHAVDQAGMLVSSQANEREDQIRREGRQAIGEQVAATAQSGIGFTQTTNDSIGQSEANVSLDALNARYAGLVERTNYINQASALRAKSKSVVASTALSAGAKALSGVGGYLAMGGKIPSFGAKPATGAASAGLGLGGMGGGAASVWGGG